MAGAQAIDGIDQGQYAGLYGNFSGSDESWRAAAAQSGAQPQPHVLDPEQAQGMWQSAQGRTRSGSGLSNISCAARRANG